MSLPEEHPVCQLMYTVIDPQAPLKQCPAITSIMYAVCRNDAHKFREAMRLSELLMLAAYEKGKKDGKEGT